jgi:hypothetical protein
MKWFCYISGIYFFALACIPCSDAEQPYLFPATTTVYLSNPTIPKPGSNCIDFCSPLCSCCCCGAHVQPKQHILPTHIILAKKAESSICFYYQLFFDSPNLQSLFRPPQAA